MEPITTKFQERGQCSMNPQFPFYLGEFGGEAAVIHYYEPGPSIDYSNSDITKHVPGPWLVRVKRVSVVYNAVTYTQGQEFYIPRDELYEDAIYRERLERVSGFDDPETNHLTNKRRK